MGRDCRVYNTGKIVASSLQKYIAKHSELNLSKNANLVYYTTGDPERFKKQGVNFLQQKLKVVKKVELKNFL